MATNNAVNVGLSGATGTGNFVGANTPTLITPALGAATATSINFGASATNGLIGVTGATNASSGVVGEFISSVVASASGVSLTTLTPANVTSISLTAGDWDVWGNVFITNSSNDIVYMYLWSSTTSATLPDSSLYTAMYPSGSSVSDLTSGLNIPFARYNVSSTTTVYLSVQTQFGGGTSKACGGIYARRVR